MFELLLTKAAAIRDPFEQSLFLMVHIEIGRLHDGAKGPTPRAMTRDHYYVALD